MLDDGRGKTGWLDLKGEIETGPSPPGWDGCGSDLPSLLGLLSELELLELALALVWLELANWGLSRLTLLDSASFFGLLLLSESATSVFFASPFPVCECPVERMVLGERVCLCVWVCEGEPTLELGETVRAWWDWQLGVLLPPLPPPMGRQKPGLLLLLLLILPSLWLSGPVLE